MADTDLQSGGTDLSLLLDPKGTGTASTTNIKDNSGNDINTKYKVLAEGSAPSTTNWQVNGSDLNTIFAVLDNTPTISPVGDGQQTSVNGLSGNCYAGIQFNSNGIEYERDPATGTFNINKGNWLDSGSASDVWVEFVRTAGAAWNDPGPPATLTYGVRYNLGTTREWKMYRVSFGESTITGYFRFWDAASGGNQITPSSATSEWSCTRVAPQISLSSNSITRSNTSGPVYAGLRYNALGSERENVLSGLNNTTFNINHGDGVWLDSGDTQNESDVWISRVINSGNLDFDSGGTDTSPLWMNLQRTYGVTDSTQGGSAETANVTFKMWPTSGGSTNGGLLDSATVSFSADYQSATPSISPSAPSRTYQQTGSAPVALNKCFVGVKWDANGTEYRLQDGTDNTWVSVGPWLDSGSASAVWVKWNGTGWNSSSPGTGRYNLGTTRVWKEWRSSTGISSTTGTWEFYDVASGGTPIGTAGSRTYKCIRVPIVNTSSITSNFKASIFPSTCYSIIELKSSDQLVYKNTSATSTTTVSTTLSWMTDGDSDDTWVRCVVTGNTVSGPQGASTYTALTTSPKWTLSNTIIDTTKSASLALTFWSTSSGGTQLGSKTITLSAEVFNDA